MPTKRMVDTIWNNWLLIALVPPFLYALVALLDAYCIENELYRTAREGTIISALFGALPLLLPLTGQVQFILPSPGVSLVGFLLGVVFSMHVYFYVAALLKRNDTVLAETIQNMAVLCVPFFAYILLDETLSSTHLLGIGAAGVAVLVMYRVNKPVSRKNFTGCTQLIIAMLLFSITLVGGDWVYTHTDFWSGFSLFCLGMLATAIVMYLFGEKWRTPLLLKRHWRLFLLIEGITTLGIMCSMRAVDVSPSATFVAITECLGAYFILAISLLIFWLHRIFGKGPTAVSKVCVTQLDDYPQKIVAGVVISSGIYMVYGA